MDDSPKKPRKPKKAKAKRKKGIDVITHMDDQIEGAIMQSTDTLKPYCDKGVMIIHGDNGNWKVITFGEGDGREEFMEVLTEALNVGARALLEGPDGATHWQA